MYAPDRQPRIDLTLIITLVSLMVVGALFIFSATMVNESAAALPWYRQQFVLQLIWYAIGIAAAILICLVDYRVMARWSMVIYWMTIISLLLVFVIGSTRGGAKRWISLGFVQIQPSEFAKLGLIFALGHFLSRPTEELRSLKTLVKALLLTFLPFALIMVEPDLGSALILIPVCVAMLLVSGIPLRYLYRLVGGASILVTALVAYNLFAPADWPLKLEEYQRRRLLVYFKMDFARPGDSPAQRAEASQLQREFSYNVDQAVISVGSGGLFGKGWRQGTQNALGYLPRGVAHNDFIFSVIAEEKGFMGSVTVVALYSVLLFTGVRIAGQTRDRLGKLLAVGVVTMFFGHVFVNIGMNIRLMPVTGVPLPLLSYGGSSVLCTLIAAGILQNVYIYRRSY